MKIIYSTTFLVVFALGAFLGVQSFIRSKKIFSGSEKGSFKVLADSALAGLSVSLLFFGGVNFVATVTDNSYQSQTDDLFISFALFLIPGFIVFVGSLWQYFQVGIFRKALLEFLKKRGNNQKRK